MPNSLALPIRGLLLAAVITLPATGWASSIAVKRGQAKVDPTVLPLVCLEVGTRGIALPIDTIVFANMDTGKEETMYLTDSFKSSHPDILTAVAGGSVSLSLPILKFDPGRYRIKSIDFVSGGASYMTLNLAQTKTFWFQVQAGCVNYVGGLEIYTDWKGISRKMSGPLLNNEARRVQSSMTVTLCQTAQRDARWACDVDPGMLSLPMALSQIRAD